MNYFRTLVSKAASLVENQEAKDWLTKDERGVFEKIAERAKISVPTATDNEIVQLLAYLAVSACLQNKQK